MLACIYYAKLLADSGYSCIFVNRSVICPADASNGRVQILYKIRFPFRMLNFEEI